MKSNYTKKSEKKQRERETDLAEEDRRCLGSMGLGEGPLIFAGSVEAWGRHHLSLICWFYKNNGSRRWSNRKLKKLERDKFQKMIPTESVICDLWWRRSEEASFWVWRVWVREREAVNFHALGLFQRDWSMYENLKSLTFVLNKFYL